jgi:uncharacterized integral membrane protein
MEKIINNIFSYLFNDTMFKLLLIVTVLVSFIMGCLIVANMICVVFEMLK